MRKDETVVVYTYVHYVTNNGILFYAFQDMVNRRISMDLMMQAASAQVQRQFIFLTPQDMRFAKKKKKPFKVFLYVCSQIIFLFL